MSFAERQKNWRVAWILNSKRGLCDSGQLALTDQPEATPQADVYEPFRLNRNRDDVD